MKIAIYWEQEGWGGVDSQLLTLIQNWPVDADRFIIFTNKNNSGYERIKSDLERNKNISFMKINSISFNATISHLNKFKFNLIPKIVAYVFQPILFILMYHRQKFFFKQFTDCDVFLSNNGGYPAAWGCLSALVAAKAVGMPVQILLVHHAATRPSLFMGWYERLIDGIISKSTSAIVTVSRATQAKLLEHRFFNPEQIRLRVIHNTPPSANFLSICPQIDTITDFSIPDQIKIGIVGRLDFYKGHEDLIFAVSRIPQSKLAGVKFYFIGRGDEDSILALQNTAKSLDLLNYFNFMGYVTGDSLEIISKLDLLISATRSFEGFGLTIAEAIVTGVPVIATNVGAVAEFVDETKATLVSPNSPGELAYAIENFLDYRDIWVDRARRAKDLAWPDPAAMSKEYRLLFVECLAARGIKVQ